MVDRRTSNSIADDGHQLFARAESAQVHAHLFNNDAVVAKRSQEMLTTIAEQARRRALQRGLRRLVVCACRVVIQEE